MSWARILVAAVVIFSSFGTAKGQSLIISTFTPEILRCDALSGEFDGKIMDSTGLPTGVLRIAAGSDGYLYAAIGGIQKRDITTGAIIDTFETLPAAYPGYLAFGPDGLLYYSRPFEGVIDRYDPATGEYLGVFVQTDPAVIRMPGPMEFDAAGDLYLGGGTRDQGDGSGNVVKYDGQTGEFLGEVVPATIDGLTSQYGIEDMTVGPDGGIYFVKGGAFVYRLDSATTEAELFASYGRLAPAIAFGPDGNLYAGSEFWNGVLEFDGITGEFLGMFVTEEQTQGRVFDIVFTLPPPPEPTACELLDELIDYVGTTDAKAGIKNSLTSKLANAQAALCGEDVDLTSGINKLRAFVNAVKAQRGKQISLDDADFLVATAEAIVGMVAE